MNVNGKPTGVLGKLALQCADDSKRWFPDYKPDVPYFALCMAGEVGEFANMVKKVERGSLDPNDAKVRYDMVMELTDVFIYLLNLAGMLNVDLEAAYNVKRQHNEQRWGPASKSDPKR